MEYQKEFMKLIKEHEGIIYKVSRAYCNQLQDQKDLYQEIIYRLWKSHSSFQGKSKYSTWMYRIALNTSISYVQKKKKNDKVLDSDYFIDRIEQVDQIIEERVKILYDQIQNLNIIEKGIILLYLEGKSYEEIAEITGFSKTNISTRLNRIKSKLKKEIKK